MAHAVVVFFDAETDNMIRALWRRLDDAGIPNPGRRAGRAVPPHMTFALAGAIPVKTRDVLREELVRLAVPTIWLSTLGTFPTTENLLVLGAVVDSELLAVHSGIHDVLAKRVRAPSAYYLPGSWVPHCTMATGIDDEQVIAGFTALHPVPRISASVSEIAVVDTRTGDVDSLVRM
jgi:2'-5' RNA ligase